MAYWFETKAVIGALDKNHRRNERVKATMVLDLLAAFPLSTYIISLAKSHRGRLSDTMIMLVANRLNDEINRFTGETYSYSAYYRRMMLKAKRMR